MSCVMYVYESDVMSLVMVMSRHVTSCHVGVDECAMVM